MKRSILFFILAVFTMTSSMAQGSIGFGAARVLRPATVASERLTRQILRQSQRASQSARDAAFRSRIKINPFGLPSVALPNLDTDDQKRKTGMSGVSGIKPISPKMPDLKYFGKIRSFRERMDEIIAANHDMIRMCVLKGEYDDMPYRLFLYADYAKRHNDEFFAAVCLLRINTNQVTPSLLEYVARRFTALEEYLPELSRSVAINAYEKMVQAKCYGVDCDSARMRGGDTLLTVTGKYNPTLNPLVILSCFYDPSKEVERYKETADSVVATYDQWPDVFKDTFARDFEITMMDKGEHAAVLDYFGREPLKQFPESMADFDIDLATCAMIPHNDSLFTHYLRQALELDSVAAENYWTQLYGGFWELFAADPSQTELADWLIEYSVAPANNALVLSIELIERYMSDTDSLWMWETLSDYAPELETVRRTVLHILDKGTAIDEGRSEANIAPYISLVKAAMLMVDPATTADAKSMLDNLAATDQPDLRCSAIIGQAYIAAHGLDKPKEAMKILKKNAKLLDDPSVTDITRGTWYEYMAVLATRLGKIKHASKYLKLKEATENEYNFVY